MCELYIKHLPSAVVGTGKAKACNTFLTAAIHFWIANLYGDALTGPILGLGKSTPLFLYFCFPFCKSVWYNNSKLINFSS